MPQANGDVIQTIELAKQKEGPGAPNLTGKAEVPVAHGRGIGQKWAQKDLLPVFLSHLDTTQCSWGWRSLWKQGLRLRALGSGE